MKKGFHFFNVFISIQSIVISSVLCLFILFFLGKDFYYVCSLASYNSEKKYQDEEQSEKSEKEPDSLYSIISESFLISYGLTVDCSNLYFAFSQKERCRGFSDILSPPPDTSNLF